MHTYIWYVPRFNPPSDATPENGELSRPSRTIIQLPKIAIAHLVLARLQMSAPPPPLFEVFRSNSSQFFVVSAGIHQILYFLPSQLFQVFKFQ